VCFVILALLGWTVCGIYKNKTAMCLDDHFDRCGDVCVHIRGEKWMMHDSDDRESVFSSL
jgi:hypothetical protein